MLLQVKCIQLAKQDVAVIFYITFLRGSEGTISSHGKLLDDATDDRLHTSNSSAR